MAERRERILEAAREIIADKGYEALTMRDLARASCVTVPTVYNLVGSKDRVLLAAVEEQTDRFIAGIGGVMLTYIVGMPSMTRTRFATPTIGRDWMIGSEGTVVSAVAPDGIVRVGDAEWRARTNRATPVEAGDTIRVVAIDGITLEVEPLEGAARDYRR